MGGVELRAVRIPIPGSEVASSIAVAVDRHSLEGHAMPYEKEAGGAEKAEAFVRRIEENLEKLAAFPKGKDLLKGISRMRPLDVATGKAGPATGRTDINTIFFRGLPGDRKAWPDDIRKDFEKRSQKQQLEDGFAFVMDGPMAVPIDTETDRKSDGNGSESMIGMPDDPIVVIGRQPDTSRFALDESLAVGHELIHAAHNLQGADATLPDAGKLPVEVPYKDPSGKSRTETAYIDAEEVSTLGGKDRKRYLTSVTSESGKGRFGYKHMNNSWKLLKEAEEAAKKTSAADRKALLKEVRKGREKTFDITETDLAKERGVPARQHYALPYEFENDWGKQLGKIEDLFTVPPGLAVTDKDLKNPDRLMERLQQAETAALHSCSPGRRSMICRPSGRPEDVSEETKQRIEEAGRVLEEQPDTPVWLPWEEDAAAERQQARSEAEAAGKQLEKRLGERAKELCAASGEAACLGKVDWEKARKELRADAEELVEKKLLAVENVKDIKLDKDFAAALGDASGFYLPYDKTREAVSGHTGEGGDHTGINASKLADKAGKAMWLAGIAQAFVADSSNLDKAAAVTAMMPAVGNLMQLSADAVKQDWTHLGFDAAFVLLEGAEFLGLEAAGPAGWAVMGIELIVDQFINFAKKEAEKGAMLDTMAKQAHDGALRAVSDTSSKGWMAHGGSTTVLQMALAMMQTVEVQRASVKGVARAIGAADSSSTVPDGTDLRKETWAADKQFADADAKADALATQSLAEIRKAVARRLADQLNKLWDDEKTQKKFVEPYASRYAELEYGDGYTGEYSRGSKVLACAGRDSSWPNETLCGIWNFKPKPVDAAEVEEILKAMGLPGTAAPQRDTVLAGLLTAQGASGQVDAVMPVPGADREYWAFSGGQYVRMRLDDKADGRKLAATLTGKGGPAPVKSNWRSLEALLAVSKTGRIDAAMPVPGADRDLYVFSGDQYTRIRLDGDLKDTAVGGYDKPRSLPEKWSSLEDLFAKSGAQRVDAVQAVPGNNTEYYVFSGSWYTTIRLDDNLKDWQMVGSRRISSGWPMLVGESGQDQVQGLMPVPGTDRDFYVFTNGGYARANAKTLRLQTPNAAASAWVMSKQAQIFWSNGADLPADAKLIAREQGSDEEHSYPARDGKSDYWTAPTVNLWESGKQRVIDVHYRYTHPDGTVEWSPSSTVKFECSPAVCKGIPQH